MAAEFVPLADWLTRCAAEAPVSIEAAPSDSAASGVHEQLDSPSRCEPVLEDLSARDCDAAGALRDARLFRARLSDAFDAAAARLLRELASDVLARELRLAPCELDALVRRAGEGAPVVRVRVAPGDLLQVAGVPVVADETLRAGDAIVELHGGALDARLGVRVAAALDAALLTSAQPEAFA